MRPECEFCGYHFEREPGYWLGSMTMGYALVAGVGVALFIGAQFMWTWPLWLQIALWSAYTTAAVLLTFPYMRLAWILVDFRFMRPPGPRDFQPRSSRNDL
jgi:uncharacterized protein (DUF983 family)